LRRKTNRTNVVNVTPWERAGGESERPITGRAKKGSPELKYVAREEKKGRKEKRRRSSVGAKGGRGGKMRKKWKCFRK